MEYPFLGVKKKIRRVYDEFTTKSPKTLFLKYYENTTKFGDSSFKKNSLNTLTHDFGAIEKQSIFLTIGNLFGENVLFFGWHV